jgi:hypothetical protein
MSLFQNVTQAFETVSDFVIIFKFFLWGKGLLLLCWHGRYELIKL